MEKPKYLRIMATRIYKTRDGEQKKEYGEVGVLFPSRHIDGGFDFKLNPGAVIMQQEGVFYNANPPKPKDDDDNF